MRSRTDRSTVTDADTIDDRTRRRLLAKVDKPSGTVGQSMPDELEVEGATIDLREFVVECSDLDTLSTAQRERIEEVTNGLRRERLSRKRRLENEAITEETGERLVEEIQGIERAITALEGIDRPDVEEQLREKELEDARELMTLVRRME